MARHRPSTATAPVRPGIAIVSHGHPSISRGGAEISAYALFQGLRDAGLRCSFIAACPEASMARVVLGGEGEFLIACDPRAYSPFFHLGPPGPIERLRRLLDDLDVGIVNAHHFLGFGVNMLPAIASPRRAVVFTLHEFLALCHHHGQMVTAADRLLCHRSGPSECADCFPALGPVKFALRREAFQTAFETSAGFVSPSRFLASRYVDWGLDPARMHVIENGLSTSATPLPARVAGAPWRFGYFGQINPYKGVDLLLDAAELIAAGRSGTDDLRIRIHGHFVGEVDALAGRVKAAAGTGLIEYHGPYRNADVGELMADCDYVVMASRWWENSPVVIQEAYQAGCPVIVPGIGGMAEKVADRRSGLHFRPGNAGDLARALLEAADPVLHCSLLGTLPQPPSALAMARDYLALFDTLRDAGGRDRAASGDANLQAGASRR